MKPEIIIICGATASGKSKLAIELAKKINSEIISADSLAVYKGLDIGTAKPTIEERNEVKHHLIDVVDPTENFSVFDFERLSIPIIDDLIKQGKTPIICGGTGFYINSILYNLSYGNSSSNLEIRDKFKQLASEKGNEYVYNVLKEVDEKSAEKIHPNDIVRTIRALEIFYSTGKKKSEQNDKEVPRYSFKAFMPTFDRQILYERIEKRVDLMLENGLIEEVKSLVNRGVDKSYQCMQGIGYKEVYDCIINGDFNGLSELLKLNSRHYAKRQITFFKRLNGLEYLTGELQSMVEYILKSI